MRSSLYAGHVTHERRTPIHRFFRYRVAMWWIDVDELDALSRRLRIGRSVRLFGTGRGAVVSVRSQDHLGDPALSIKDNARAFLAASGVAGSVQTVVLLTNARLFGHVFNPLSLLYCHDGDGRLLAVIAEVHNTFGERHCYLVPAAAVDGHVEDKAFYVSPFLEVAGRYRMRVPPPAETLRVSVALEQRGTDVFHASLTGRRIAITRRSVVRVLLAYPLLTLRITALIRWQALRLWLRRVPVVPRSPELDAHGDSRR